MNTEKNILDFWFGTWLESGLPTAERTSLWFIPNADIDEKIKDEFTEVTERAMRGEFDQWADDPHSRLALIIVLDQFTRHIFRDTPIAFSQDKKAQDLCVEGIRKRHDQALTLMERVFFYMPLIHAEDLELQKLGLKRYQDLTQLSLPEIAGIYQSILEYANQHYIIIQKFHRFPHRNKILQRESTPEESEFVRTSAVLG